MNTPKFNPESQIQHLPPDEHDDGAPVAYVCGVPVGREEGVDWNESEVTK